MGVTALKCVKSSHDDDSIDFSLPLLVTLTAITHKKSKRFIKVTDDCDQWTLCEKESQSAWQTTFSVSHFTLDYNSFTHLLVCSFSVQNVHLLQLHVKDLFWWHDQEQRKRFPSFFLLHNCCFLSVWFCMFLSHSLWFCFILSHVSVSFTFVTSTQIEAGK